ncbi:EAL domain-containing protein [Enterobacter roggenkampii]|uniref:EAL domain-containing protein n=1 Tax=Enterobacter roggenkampii TaxID=1812935 RepID=UPI000DA162E0|nr:EAL domain-containing protein [Enterobacter roggenkampii]
MNVDLIKQAVEQKQFHPYLQPIFSANTLTVAGAEILVRLITDDGDVISPAHFIEDLESTEYIHAVTRNLLEEVSLSLCEEARFPHRDFYFSLNVTYNQLGSMALPSICKTFIDRFSFLHQPLAVEITERVPSGGEVTQARIIEMLSALNVRFLIDDFGTGYSSLSYLLKYPISSIKVDPEFTRSIRGSDKLVHILDALRYLSDKLNITIIAEGVENQEDMDILRMLKVDYLQGFLLGKPVPLNNFLDLWLKL